MEEEDGNCIFARAALQTFQDMDKREAEDAHRKPGEVWLTDLGMQAKVRPCLVLTQPPRNDELAVVTQ